MRILHVTHLYRPALGGAEQHITDQSEELARRGHQVDVFTVRSTKYHTWESDPQLLPVECLDNVNVYRFDAFKRGPFTWKLLNLGTERLPAHQVCALHAVDCLGQRPDQPAAHAGFVEAGAPLRSHSRQQLALCPGVLRSSHCATAERPVCPLRLSCTSISPACLTFASRTTCCAQPIWCWR